MTKRLLLAAAIALLTLPRPALAVSDADISAMLARIKAMEQELELLKRQKEVDDEKAKSAAEKFATVEFGKKGLKISSPDKKYELTAKGYVQIDYRNFLGDNNNTGRNDFIARRIRPSIEGKAGNASFRIMPDFAGSTTRIFDAHIDYKVADALQFRLGKFKPPVGLERLQSATDMFFIERGHPTNFAPTRDLGFQVYGSLFGDKLEYQLGVFNGTTDLGNTDNDSDDRKDVAGRIFAQPFRDADWVAFQGLGLGIGGSTGDRAGAPNRTILGSYVTPGQQAFFSYISNAAPTVANTVFASGAHQRIYPQGYWYYGNMGLLAEYAVSEQRVTRNNVPVTLKHDAWQAAVSYVLTGEDVNFRGGIKPDADFGIGSGGWGAWEAVARVGETDIDNAAFPVYANPATSASKAETIGGGLNWYLNENTKFAVNYDYTAFKGGAAAGLNRPDEEALFSRLQFRL